MMELKLKRRRMGRGGGRGGLSLYGHFFYKGVIHFSILASAFILSSDASEKFQSFERRVSK